MYYFPSVPEPKGNILPEYRINTKKIMLKMCFSNIIVPFILKIVASIYLNTATFKFSSSFLR